MSQEIKMKINSRIYNSKEYNPIAMKYVYVIMNHYGIFVTKNEEKNGLFTGTLKKSFKLLPMNKKCL